MRRIITRTRSLLLLINRVNYLVCFRRTVIAEYDEAVILRMKNMIRLVTNVRRCLNHLTFIWKGSQRLNSNDHVGVHQVERGSAFCCWVLDGVLPNTKPIFTPSPQSQSQPREIDCFESKCKSKSNVYRYRIETDRLEPSRQWEALLGADRSVREDHRHVV